jgi:hypothetical protein
MNTIELEAKYAVMASAVEDILESHISGAIDSLIAAAQIRHELPALHRARRARFSWLCKDSLTLYRGRIDWCGIGFDYVEHGGNLHIVDVWPDYSEDRSTRKVDCVIGQAMDAEKYLTVTEVGAGVSLIR